MENSIKLPEGQGTTKGSKSGSLLNKELAGKITGHIGTGRNAKDSFIWMTITWSFYIASGISILLFARSFSAVAESEELLASIVQVWSLFVPIITLALGYAFGKGE
jgi:hypothetical protein